MKPALPVTIFTGALGAGKTTLLNHLLRGDHGLRLLVLVNEFGEAGIDGELIAGGAEDVLEMSNGCVCCSMKGDLLQALHRLLPKLSGYDGVVLETTGLAAPGPVAQTFLLDELLRARLRLEGIVTVVDARHVLSQIAASSTPGPEVRAQIAFADRIILNKTDLVSGRDIAAINEALFQINPRVTPILAERGKVAAKILLNHDGFSLEAIEGQLSGLNAHDTHDHHCGPDCGHDHHEGGHHHSDISTVLVRTRRPLDETKVSDFLAGYLAQHGLDILRMKGILEIAGEPRKLAFHAVHMLLEGDYLEEWAETGPRESRMVFIGRNLKAQELQQGLEGCSA